MKNILKCPVCSSPLKLKVAFSGCDWDTEAGEGSGYGYALSLECSNNRCARIYILGYLESYSNFSPVKDDLKPFIK